MVADFVSKCKVFSDEELFKFNEQGFIPGPQESEEAFFGRVESALEFFKNPPLDFREMEKIPDTHWDWTRHHLKEIYDFCPHSVIGYYSNKKLLFWQGAATWIMEGPQGESLCAVQLRKAFFKGRFLGYSRDEILAHEAVHAARCSFLEPANEEFFAYFTSSAKWRRAIGPILQKPWEAALFLFISSISALFGFYVPLIVLLLVAFIRLSRQHRKLRSAAKTLARLGRTEKAIRAILFRLSDKEIDILAQGRALKDDGSPRFRVIRHYMEGEIWQKKL